ncbi:Nucleoporin NUP145N [Naviculisporaceae sp. PSN 640]
MSFFGSGGGGFGQQNTQPTNTFGGFGSTTNTTNTGFGASGGGFGSTTNTTTPSTGLFGGSTGTGFGTTSGGFGSGTSAFGAKPATTAFGTPATTTASTGLFGSTSTAAPATTGFGSGGFGSTATNTASTGFGTGGGLFGSAAKPATGFGSTPATTGFGSTTTGNSLFGSGTTSTTPAFGATNNPGIGTNVTDPPGTTTPFNAFQEKEGTAGTNNTYQNIGFMDVYKKWSTEELRLADYNQGRRSGGMGGTGTFGASGFGTATGGFGTNTATNTGFGSTGGMFGNTGASTGFGANNTTTTPAFGATSSTNTGGLFGAKPAAPATGGLFGSTTPAQPATGGLFGSSTTPAFGSTTTNAFGANNTSTSGGGLFGSANNAAKPAGGLFGSTGTTTTGTGLFGGANTTTPAFGSTSNTTTGNTGGLFGSTPAANTAGGGLFGGQTQQPATGTGFGTGTAFGGAAQNTGGLFGSAAAKPAGTFGTTPAANTGATGGLFGSSTSTTTPFGGTAATQPAATGGLFGAKPAATGGLFGGSTTAQPATGGLFGNTGATNTQAQQPATGGLFGSSTAAKPGGLFGSTQPATGGLFGSTTNQTTGGAFGSSVAQPQAGGLGSSLFGASQAQQQPQAFSTSINDISAYGASTLFTNLTDDKVANPGPLATPLSGKAKTRSRSILPMYKLSPANASRFATPRKQGYGFSYSTYGSPSSPSSAASTPGGFGQSLLVGGSIGRSGLSKSISASNLRRSFNVEDSILSPGAFSSSSGPRLLGSSSTHKKLVINRDLRADLFTTPAKEQPAQEANGKHKLSKRVSFETTPAEASSSGQETIRESIEGGSTPGEDLGYIKPTSSLKSSLRTTTTVTNGSQPPSVTATPEVQQVKGNELAIVHEEASPEQTRTSAKPGSAIEPGSYWMSPSLEQIRAMNRVQRSKVDFTVGRENVGSIEFKVPVDLNNVDFENIFDEIVVLLPRSATVYPISAKKPVVGKGLNVPARISLEHSYPRGGISTSERKIQRHVERLKATPDTTFEDYDKETGVWTFSVEHFTTYGLDDDDEEDEMTDAEPSVTQLPTSSATKHSLESPTVDPDDTFEFKRSKRAVPGAFDEDAMTDEELVDNAPTQGMSFPEFDDVDVPAQPQGWYDDQSMEDEQDVYQQDIVEQGSQDDSTEEVDDDFALGQYASNEGLLPGGIMRARMRAVKKSTAPTRIEVAGGDDWTQILQASVRAPRTVDRVALRALNESGAVWDMQDRGSPAPKSQPVVTDGAGFQTSIDLMKSLFEKPKGLGEPIEEQPARGFVKWPYQKRDKIDAPENDVPPPRPTWGPNELFVATQNNETNILPVEGNGVGSEVTKKQLSQLQQYIEYLSTSKNDHNMPAQPTFRELAQDDPVWELAGLLFDDNGANLAGFWKQIVSDTTDAALLHADTPEEKAIICLAGHRVADACGHLMEARNFRLAGLVASIGSGPGLAKDIRAQLNDWRESNVLSEFSEPIRAIYELLGGNACVCAGVKNVSIENRVSSFTISQRFGLDWMQAFGLRLFYTSSVGELVDSGWGSGVAETAVRSFATDIEQDREPEPDHPLWSLLKIFAFKQFDWSDPRLGWLLTKSIYATHKVAFGGDAEEKLDMASLKFAASLTATAAASVSIENKNLWVQAAFVLGDLSNHSSKEAAVREHLGRHAHLIGSPKDPHSPFAAMVKFGVPEAWIWEAKALHFRSKEDSRQEFLALIWAGNYKEANRAFVERVAPALVIQRDFDRLFRFAELLFKVGKGKPEWEQGGANVYLLYPLAIANLNGSGGQKGLGLLGDDEKLLGQLLDGLVALRAQSHGDIRQEAAIADMAENLIRGSGYLLGNDQKLYGLLPEDVRGKYLRARALETVC